MPIPFRQETRAQLRRRVGYLLFGRDKFQYATASAGAVNSATLAFIARSPDNAWVGKTAYIASGTGSGQYRAVSASSQSASTITPATNFAPAPDATSVIELWPEGVLPDDVNEALSRAVLRASDIVQIVSDQQPASLVAITGGTDTIGVVLPANMVRVAQVRYLDSAQTWHNYYPAEWLNRYAGDTFTLGPSRTLYFYPPIPSSITQANMHCLGYRLPADFTADTDLCEVPPQYLIYFAAAMLDAGEAYGAELDPEQHSGRAANWLREAAALEPRMVTDWLPGTVNVVL